MKLDGLMKVVIGVSVLFVIFTVTLYILFISLVVNVGKEIDEKGAKQIVERIWEGKNATETEQQKEN